MSPEANADIERLERAVLAAASISMEQGHPPVLDDSRFDRLLRELLGHVTPGKPLEHDWTDSSARAVISMLLYRRVLEDLHWAHIEAADIQDPEESYDDDDDAFLDTELEPLRTYLDRVEVSTIPDQSHLLWELHAACVAGYTTRVTAICDQLVARHPDIETFQLAVQDLFLVLNASPTSLKPKDWIPFWTEGDSEREGASYVLLLGTSLVAVEIDALLSRRFEPATLSPVEQQVLLRLQSWLTRLAALQPLKSLDLVVLGWTRFRLGAPFGELVGAGEDFGRVANAHDFDSQFKTALLRAASCCFLRAGRADLAESALGEALSVTADRAPVLLQLARCCDLQDKERETLDAYERFVRESPTAATDDFQTSLALRFGLLARQRGELRDFLASAAMASPLKLQCEALIAWMEPFYSRLSERARNRWWFGLFLISWPHNVDRLGSEVWNQSAEAFAEVVNFELKGRVFRRFVGSLTPDDKRTALAEPNVAQEWKRIISGRGTLGQHLKALLQAARDEKGFPRQLRRWLEAYHPAVLHAASSNPSEIASLSPMRNDAAHEEVSEVEARRVFQISRTLLDTLTRTDGQEGLR